MKIECPSCHVAGTIDESRLPASGKLVVCPRCGHGFTAKPPPKKWSRYMMNTCPVCDYSTFSEETFAVCPRCGLDGEEYHTRRLKQEKRERDKRCEEIPLPPLPDPPPSKQTVSRPEEASSRSTDLPLVIQIVGWGVSIVAVVTGVVGLVGTAGYLGTDWHQKILEERGEEVGGFTIFLSRGMLPLLMICYSLFAGYASQRFLRQGGGEKRLVKQAAWGLMGILVMKEIQEVVQWFGRSSDRASIGYYLTGLSGGVLMTLLWGGLIFVFTRFLESDTFDDRAGG